MLEGRVFAAEARSSMTLSERSGGNLIIPIDKRKGQAPSVASIHRALGRTPGCGTAGIPVLSWVGKTAWTSR
jgi:hypothetical protein